MNCDNMNVLMCVLLIIILILVIKCFISNKTKEGFVYSRCAANPGGAWSGPNSDGLYYKYYSSNKKKDAAYATLCVPAEKELRDSQVAAAAAAAVAAVASSTPAPAPAPAPAVAGNDNDGWVKDVNDENRWKCDEYSNNNNFCKDHRCSIEPDQNTYENKWERCGDNGEWCTKRSQGGLTDSIKRKIACITTKNFSDEDRMNKSESVGWMCTAEGKNWLGNTSICKSHKCNTNPTDYDKDRNIWKICDTDKYCTRTIQKQKIDSDKREEACKQATQAKLAGAPDTSTPAPAPAVVPPKELTNSEAQSYFGSTPGASSTGLSPNDCSCNDEDIKKNIKDIMSNAQEKLKIDIESGTFTCVASNGITPATCPWDK
jgi:hypothetical protein